MGHKFSWIAAINLACGWFIPAETLKLLSDTILDEYEEHAEEG